MSLSELAERCEQATTANRTLDAEIYVGLDPELENLDALAINGAVGSWVPYFTASLDDAMTLVPEGWGVRLETPSLNHSPVVSPPSAAMLHNLPRRATSAGATPALALCAAALRARAAQGTEARRAETVKQGSVHDGPVRDSECAQKDSQ